ncbi:SUF system Fe-S cluster assembly regulator [Myxococcota bacterium]|nr:SUF system Fe-S cluster assembly regulator [Myxococcota bacterium]
MFRLSKVSDYGIVVLAHLARNPVPASRNAREIAHEVQLPAPMVSKILKSLARQGVLESQRGAQGGYQLARPPEAITVGQMITILEGPMGLTECALGADLCTHEGSCEVQSSWQLINRVISDALQRVTLADLIDPAFDEHLSTDDILNRVRPTRSSSVDERPEPN